MSKIDKIQDKDCPRYMPRGKEAISEEIILWEKYLKLYESQLKSSQLKSKKFLQNNIKSVTKYLDELRRSLSP